MRKGIALKRFDSTRSVDPSGENWVSAYWNRKNNGETFSYSAEYIAPYSMNDIWNALQQIQYFSNWFSSFHTLRDDLSIPDNYGPGQFTPDKRAIVVDFSHEEGFVFRQNDAFFILKLIDYGPTQCKLTLKCCDFRESPPGFVSGLLSAFSNEKERDQSADIENTRRRLIRVAHLTEDLKKFGQPVTGQRIEGASYNWIIWNHPPGTLHVLTTIQGTNQIKVGDPVEKGKIAYVVTDELRSSGKQTSYFIENWYVENYHEGTIVELKKNNGDRIEYGDRLILVKSK